MDADSISATIKTVTTAGFLSLPWISQISRLNWHFKLGTVSQSKLFNTLAAILSSLVFSYLSWQEPGVFLVLTPTYWWFVSSLGSIVVYYGLYIKYGGQVPPSSAFWILPTALSCYIVVCTTLAVFTASVLARHDYYIISGVVSEKSTPQMKSLGGAKITLMDDSNISLKDTFSDATGRFVLPVRKPKSTSTSSPWSLQADCDGYQQYISPLFKQDNHTDAAINLEPKKPSR